MSTNEFKETASKLADLSDLNFTEDEARQHYKSQKSTPSWGKWTYDQSTEFWLLSKGPVCPELFIG